MQAFRTLAIAALVSTAFLSSSPGAQAGISCGDDGSQDPLVEDCQRWASGVINGQLDCDEQMAAFDLAAGHAFDQLENQEAAQAVKASLRQNVQEQCLLDAVPLEETDTPKCTSTATEKGVSALYCGMWCGWLPRQAHYWVDMDAYDHGSFGVPLIFAGISCAGTWTPMPPAGISCGGQMETCSAAYAEGIKFGVGACIFTAEANAPVITNAACGTKSPPW